MSDAFGKDFKPTIWMRLLVTAVAASIFAAALAHLGLTFLYLAPSNPVSHAYESAIRTEISPEFDQDWQLFAPTPRVSNISIEARVRVARQISPWIELTASDIRAVRGDPFPSHADQNMLRRAWDFYTSTHSAVGEKPTGSTALMAADYLERIALQRIGSSWDGSHIEEIQIEAVTTPVSGPDWSGAPAQPQSTFRTLPWRPVTASDEQGIYS